MNMQSFDTGAESIYITPEHVALREQVERFLAKEVEPHAEAWEEQGYVPREVLLKMGGLGLFGITYPQQYGGAEADALTSLVFAEALSRSTFGGFIVTVLVHTDMASPHLVHAGSQAQIERYLPKVIRGEAITAVAITEPDAGSDVAGIRTRARLDGDHGNRLAADHFRKIALDLRLRPGVHQMWRGHVRMHEHGDDESAESGA